MLSKKMYRDLKDHKLQFLCVFLMAFITMFAYAGIGAEVTGISQEANDFYADTNIADAWIYSDNFSNDTIDKINGISGTQNLQRELVIDAIANVSNDPTVTMHFLEKNEISKFYPVEGEGFNIDDADGLWLDKRLADAKGLKVGDNLTVDFNGTTIEKTVRGIGYSSEYIFEQPVRGMLPDFNLQGFAYLSYKAFPTDNIPYNVVLVETDEDIASYQNSIEDKISGEYSTFVPQEDQFSVTQFNDEIDQHEMFCYIFPLLFVVVALLTLITTMTRIVNNQRTQIGTLKALGFSNRSLIIHYCSYGFVLSLIGCILGIIVGIETIPYLFFPSMSQFYTLPSWHSGFDMSFLYVMVLVVALSTLFSYIAARNIIKESPSSALKPKAPKVPKSYVSGKFSIWDRFSFTTRWNIRDIQRSKVRSLVTVVGVIGCTMLLISAFGMNVGVEDTTQWQFENIYNFDSQLVLEDNATQNQIDSIISDVNGTQLMSGSIEVRANNVTKTTGIEVRNKSDLIGQTDIHMNPIEFNESGVSVSSKVADSLGLEVGDTFQWHLYGNKTWINSTVSQIYGNPTTQGIMLSPNVFEGYGYDFVPTHIVTSSNVTGDMDGISSINTLSDLTKSWDDLTGTANLMAGVLIFFALTLSFVVLYSLGVLGFAEVERDMATLKVLGFSSNQIRKLFLVQNIWLSLIGLAIGVPLGYQVLKLVMDSSGESYYYYIHYDLTTILMSVIIIMGVSLVVNYLLSRNINDIDMVESLKKGRE